MTQRVVHIRSTGIDELDIIIKVFVKNSIT